MKGAGRVLLLMLLLLLGKSTAFSQNISNEGTEFWAVFPTHDPSRQNNTFRYANIRIYVTARVASQVEVTCGTWSSGPVTIPANQATGIPVERSYAYIEGSESNTVLSDRAVHVKVTEGMGKVAVYAHIFAGFRSAASLILPVEALGQNYYSMNYTQDQDGHNFLVLAATEANTQLLIHHKGQKIPVNLPEAGDTYEYMPADGSDLTGVFVEVDPESPDNCNKRFAAFSGSTSVIIGSCGTSRDPLFQQLYPTSSWGKMYGIIPFYNRDHLIRILALENNTTVNINGSTRLIQRGVPETIPLTGAGFVTSDKSISVAQYSYTQCGGTAGERLVGDPEMVVLNPVEFNINFITLFSSDQEDIREKYINICIPTEASGSFRINGQPPGTDWTVIPSNPDFAYTQIRVFSRDATLTASEGFNAIAYGFGTTESYAYSAGTSLAASNYLRIKNKVTEREAENACVDQASDFKIFLPAAAEKITWRLDNESPVEVESPVPTDILTNSSGIITYEYTYAYGRAFTDLARHSMQVIVKLPTVGNCIGNEYEYNYTFDVEPIPVADFSFSNLGCEFEGTRFTDLSDSKLPGKPISIWMWDFGDGSNPVSEKNPVHKFPGTGTYIVKLSVATAEGCMSDVFTKEVSVTLIPSPSVTFSPIPEICENGGLFAVNTARETRGVSGAGIYSGRGITPEGIFDPALAGPGTHEITYTFIGDQITEGGTYCQDVKRQTVTVTPIPVIELEKDFYILLQGSKQFRATSSGPNATYKWFPAIGLDRDDVLNPVINGEVDRVYTLTSTTAQGCITIDTITVHVLDGLEVANAFSPNGDGVNDVWKIDYIDSYPKVTVQVVNRYGTIVFASKGYASPFDGKYQNKDLPGGTYFYIIDPGEGIARKTGSLTIIR